MGDALQRAVLFRELPTPAAGAGPVPEWVELLPKGPEIVGFDGRKFRLDDPQALVDVFKAQTLQLPFDWEHATQVKGERGERAPAAGFIDGLEVRDGSLWGHVAWNAEGAEDISKRRYRYLSPAFLHDKAGNIRRIESAGFTNKPNLDLAALNRVDGATGDDSMTPELRKVLGLDDKATDQDAVKAVERLRGDLQIATARAEAPPLDKFVPRGDHDLALNRAVKAEQELVTLNRQQLEKEVDIELEAASVAGKITPATVAYHRAQCLLEGGLARFREFVKLAPAIAATSQLGGQTPPGAAAGAQLSELERTICRNLGLEEKDFIAARR